jgi:hypothetical protein
MSKPMGVASRESRCHILTSLMGDWPRLPFTGMLLKEIHWLESIGTPSEADDLYLPYS